MEIEQKVLFYKKVYDDIYLNFQNYNCFEKRKNYYVDIYAQKTNGNILDAGCGEGIHLKRLLNYGYNIFGIEISEICCKKFLHDTPHKCIDIISYSKENVKYDGIICMDVLEHIPYELIDQSLNSLQKMAPSIFFGIANHSDIFNGVQLHLIQQDKDWWIKKLKIFYMNVIFLTSFTSDTNVENFFMIECNNLDFKADWIIKEGNNNISLKSDKYYDLLNNTDRILKEISIANLKSHNEKKILEGTITQKEKEKIELIEQKNVLEDEKTILIEQKNELENEKKTLIEQKNELENEKKTLIEQKNELENEKKTLIEQKNELENEKKTLIEQKNELENEKKTLIEQKNELENEKKTLIEQKNELENEKKMSIEQKNELENEKKTLIEQKNELENEKKMSIEQKNELENEKKTLITNKNELKVEKVKLENENLIIQQSVSFKIGKIITFLPRKVFNILIKK